MFPSNSYSKVSNGSGRILPLFFIIPLNWILWTDFFAVSR